MFLLFVVLWVALFSFTMSSFALSMRQSHILNLLISLEAMMLSILVFLYSFAVSGHETLHSFLVLLTLAACEAALGLSLLVSLLRTKGNDLISSIATINYFLISMSVHLPSK